MVILFDLVSISDLNLHPCNLFQHTYMLVLLEINFLHLLLPVTLLLVGGWMTAHPFPGPTHSTGGRGVDGLWPWPWQGGWGGDPEPGTYIYIYVQFYSNMCGVLSISGNVPSFCWTFPSIFQKCIISRSIAPPVSRVSPVLTVLQLLLMVQKSQGQPPGMGHKAL